MTKNEVDLAARVANQELEIERLEESLNDVSSRMADLDWDLVGRYSEDGGLTLENLKDLDERLGDMAAANPLMKRAAQLRNDYVFGKGMEYKNLKPGAEKIVDDYDNERSMFSVLGYEALNLARFTSGNIFTLWDPSSKKFTRVPIREIETVIVDPDSSERVWFIKRTWSSLDQQKSVWYRTNSYSGPVVEEVKEDASPFDSKKTMFFEPYNRQVGHTFGVPDAMAAMSWALAYSNYLNNNATLVKAYAQFAFKVTQQTRKGIETAAAKIARGGVGTSALMPVGSDLSPLNATGSQVNFNNGQALAAMVATSLGLSVVALLSSPGAASGSYGAAASLDGPTLIGMVSLQEQWRLFYRSVFRKLGSKDADVEFPAIESDPVYRQIASLALAFAQGAIHQEEFRNAVLDLLDIANAKSGLPKPSDFAPGGKTSSSNGVPSQGNAGAVPGGLSQGDTNNDARTDVISKN